MTPKQFAKALLTWFDSSGRKNLPWQQTITPYRVWVSEIMLQQTQVNTVIPYFERFIQRFPDIRSLANASEDQVLHLWSGLGYYSRARNLHRSAQLVMQYHQTELPDDLTILQSLPGIGRSTAGAILAITNGQQTAILDGNVKRVLTRFHAIAGWPGQPDITRQLWTISERYTPAQRTGDYTQAIMDLGATLCTRTQPACTRCPLSQYCQAHQTGQEMLFPTPKPRKSLPIRKIKMLLLCNTAQKQILLMKRPPAGIWGGLWSFPECAVNEDIIEWCHNHHYMAEKIQPWPTFRHTFSHFHLDITPIWVDIKSKIKNQIMDSTSCVWYKIGQLPSGGLATPVQRLLQQLAQQESPGEHFHHDSNDSLSKTKKTCRRIRTSTSTR
ncbi:MAG: A/G-specific adenine glycosylase [Gammaproteobacteria bacterium]